MTKYYKVIVTIDSPYNIILSQLYQINGDELGGYKGKGTLVAQKLISDYIKKHYKKITPKIWNKITHNCKINFKRIIP